MPGKQFLVFVTHQVRAYGLHLSSELALPELFERSGAPASDDVRIVLSSLPGAPDFGPGPGRKIILQGDPTPSDDVYLHWPKVCTLRVQDGTRIEVCPHPDVSPDTLRLPLLGVGMGVLLHQRGLCTLHASAVSIHDCAAAFVGWKGAGKSTMAAILQRREHALLTDDVLALDPDTWVTHPAFPQIKLLPEAADAVGVGQWNLDRLSPDVAKLVLRDHDTFATDAQPLGALFVLGEGDLSCERLDTRDAFLALLSQTYAPRFLGSEGTGTQVMQWCTTLSKTVPVFHLRRPYDLRRVEDSATLVEATMREGTLNDRRA